jgi:hypothetical protein
MDAKSRRALIKSLKDGRHHFHTILPAEAGLYYCKRIGIKISKLFKVPKQVVLSPSEERLVAMILGNLPKLAKKAEEEWYGYHGDPSLPEEVATPHIWISRDLQQKRGPKFWTFIVNHRESPDYGWHLEFEGMKFLDVWAGG